MKEGKEEVFVYVRIRRKGPRGKGYFNQRLQILLMFFSINLTSKTSHPITSAPSGTKTKVVEERDAVYIGGTAK